MPNVSLSEYLKTARRNEEVFTVGSLHPPGLEMKHSAKTCAEASLVAVKMAEIAYADRFRLSAADQDVRACEAAYHQIVTRPYFLYLVKGRKTP